MATLVEAIKELRNTQGKKKDIIAQNVEFDFSSYFNDKPMTPSICKELSSYIDGKLVDFSKIYGTFPATVRPLWAAVSCADGDPLTRQGGSKYVRTLPTPQSVFDENNDKEGESYDGVMETQLSNVKMDSDSISNECISDDEVEEEDLRDQIELQAYPHGVCSTLTSPSKEMVIRVPQPQTKPFTGIRMLPHTDRYQCSPTHSTFEAKDKIKDISYITSYEIDRKAQTIKTCILTAPSSLVISNNEWFDMCYCGGGSNFTISDIIKSNLCIISKTRAESIALKDTNLPEQTALETLREMISEKEFRRYLRYGFLIVQGYSGNLYQIFRDDKHVKVWSKGKLLEEICVRIKNIKIPFTDNVIAFKIMIETNEDDFRKLGNIYKEKMVA